MSCQHQSACCVGETCPEGRTLLQCKTEEVLAGATQAQRDSFKRVIDRQGELLDVGRGFGSDKMIFAQFEHIFIGIEADGYAHS